MERRKGERLVFPDSYRKYITLKVRGVSGSFVDAELFNFSPQGIRIRSRYELPFNSTIECLVSAPESLIKEIPFKGRIKYCIQEEPMGNYVIGAEIIESGDRTAFEIFSKIHGFVKGIIDNIS
ncbi:MAG TPA: hypothetical protein VMV04_01660 [Thermodesulfobacteriota bacterium]|nr:hypothetical protein [Thermodesulfobacteriota bacterium]